MMEQGQLPRGDASDDTLAQFAPKAVEIFEGMPKANVVAHRVQTYSAPTLFDGCIDDASRERAYSEGCDTT